MQKKNRLHHLIACAFIITFSSCASLWNGGRLTYISNIHQGQSHEEVISIMKGEPQYRRFTEDGLEQWEYHKNRDLAGNYDVVIIGFREGRVVNMDSFNYQPPVYESVEKK